MGIFKNVMNIGFFTAEYSPQLSGAVARVKGLCKGLARAGDNVFIFVPSARFSREEDENCTVYRIPYMRFFGLGKFEDYFKFNPSRYVSFIKKCANIIKKEKIELLHARQPLDFYAAVLKLGKRFRIPVVLESHRLSSTTELTLGNCSKCKYFFLKKYELRLLNKADAVVVLSETGIKQQISEGIKAPLIIVPNAYSSDLVNAKSEKTSLSGKKFILLYNGTLRKTEGTDTLIKAVPHIAEKISSFVLIMAGDGGELENLKGLARRLGIEQHIHFAGKISDAQLKFYYENAALFVHPRKNIPYQHSFVGIKVYDSLYFGVPIVTGNFGELADFIKKEKCGILTEPDNSKSFADAIIKILENPQRLNALRKRAGITGRKYNWLKSGKILSNLYQQLSQANKNAI